MKYNEYKCTSQLKGFLAGICRGIEPRYILTVGLYPPKDICRDDLNTDMYMRNSNSDMCAFNKYLVRCLVKSFAGKYKRNSESFRIVSMIEDKSKLGCEKVMPHIHALVYSDVIPDEFAEKVNEIVSVRLVRKYGVPFYHDIQNIYTLNDGLYGYIIKNVDMYTNLDRMYVYMPIVEGVGERLPILGGGINSGLSAQRLILA